MLHPVFENLPFKMVLDKLIEATKENAILEHNKKQTQILESELAKANSQLRYLQDDLNIAKDKIKELRKSGKSCHPKG